MPDLHVDENCIGQAAVLRQVGWQFESRFYVSTNRMAISLKNSCFSKFNGNLEKPQHINFCMYPLLQDSCDGDKHHKRSANHFYTSELAEFSEDATLSFLMFDAFLCRRGHSV
jgi:hypothetical protein